MFERFTKEARDVATGSQAEARRLGHAFVGTEHILLALVQSSGLAVRVLNAAGVTVEKVQEEIPRAIGRAPLVDDEAALRMIGIDLDAVRDQIDARFGPGALERAGGRSRFGRVGSPRFTPRSKKVLEPYARQSRCATGRSGRSTSSSASCARARVWAWRSSSGWAGTPTACAPPSSASSARSAEPAQRPRSARRQCREIRKRSVLRGAGRGHVRDWAIVFRELPIP